jgi:hypothetical protein
MPDWLIFSAVVMLFIGGVFVVASRNTRRMVARTLARRPNPTEAEFMAMLGGDVRPEVAAFLWETMIPYLEPKLTPHPDDRLFDDLPIGDDDPSMDWLPEFAERHGLKAKHWPQWPEEWDGTVRNFARWLEAGLPPAVDAAA